MLDPTQLYDTSIRMMLLSQDEGGAYIACPRYVPYRYCWIRDGSYVAHALTGAGHHTSARRFHEWVHRAVILRYTEKIDHLIVRMSAGDHIVSHDYLHARFMPNGDEVNGEGWGEFQLDGYGTWLWSLAKYLECHPPDAAWYEELRPSVVQVIRYLLVLWQTPCYDSWEEGGDRVHTVTLGAIYGGVAAIVAYDPTLQEVCGDDLALVREYIMNHCLHDGRLIKSVGHTGLDAGLITLGTPYRVFDPIDAVMQKTVSSIEDELGQCGVHRYATDAYYGGGSWILLSAFLGWHHTCAGTMARAVEIRDWIVTQQQEGGALPEQVPDALRQPEHYDEWVSRQGSSASPLTWSHAMYVILESAIRERSGEY